MEQRAKQPYVVSGFTTRRQVQPILAPRGARHYEVIRDQWKTHSVAPINPCMLVFENLIDSIDSGVHMCRKRLGMEFDGENGRSRFATKETDGKDRMRAG